MFTGIIEELGGVLALELGRDSARITVRGPIVVADARPGDSIAVNGVCLTVVELQSEAFTADVMRETLQRTSLSRLRAGSRVNLERPVPAGGRLGGHVVQGHVDGTATLVQRQPGERWEVVRFAVPPALGRYLAPQGSVALDGVSLTVVAVDDVDDFAVPRVAGVAAGRPGSETATLLTVSLIPETLARTTLGQVAPGGLVNVEVDVLAKYVDRALSWRAATAAAPGSAP